MLCISYIIPEELGCHKSLCYQISWYCHKCEVCCNLNVVGESYYHQIGFTLGKFSERGPKNNSSKLFSCSLHVTSS